MGTLDVKVARFIKGLDLHISNHFVAHKKDPMGHVLNLTLKCEQKVSGLRQLKRHK